MEKICPFCGTKVKALGKHLLHCKKIPQNLSKDEIKFIGIESYVYKGFLDDLINDYKNLYSLPDLRKKYNIDFKNICWCLQYGGQTLRTLKESQHKITQPKIRKTLQENFGEGIINVGQIPIVKEKVKQTFIKHYGVDNIWKTKEYAEFTTKRWASYTPERKNELIHKWTHRDGRISKLEIKIANILIDLNIPIETQFKFPKYFHKYDIHIKNTNVIIEVQGDFWHANPKLYKETDTFNFPNNLTYTAEQIWKKDKQNIDYAKSQNYKVIQLWEYDINENIKKNNLEIFLIDILNNDINMTI